MSEMRCRQCGCHDPLGSMGSTQASFNAVSSYLPTFVGSGSFSPQAYTQHYQSPCSPPGRDVPFQDKIDDVYRRLNITRGK